MDGLNSAADVTFLLTTNRADLLEPALAARPGRVDLAAELPLPDAGARRRLIRLYQGNLVLDLAKDGSLVKRTEGVTAAFLKELLREAALPRPDIGQPPLRPPGQPYAHAARRMPGQVPGHQLPGETGGTEHHHIQLTVLAHQPILGRSP